MESHGDFMRSVLVAGLKTDVDTGGPYFGVRVASARHRIVGNGGEVVAKLGELRVNAQLSETLRHPGKQVLARYVHADGAELHFAEQGFREIVSDLNILQPKVLRIEQPVIGQGTLADVVGIG